MKRFVKPYVKSIVKNINPCKLLPVLANGGPIATEPKNAQPVLLKEPSKEGK